MISMIYLVALLALFLILVIATIAVIAGKSKRKHDGETEESPDEEDSIFQDAEDMASEDFYVDNLDLQTEDMEADNPDTEPEDMTIDEEDDAYQEEEADEFEEDFELEDMEAFEEESAALNPEHPNAPTQELDTDAVRKEKKKMAGADMPQEAEAEVSGIDESAEPAEFGESEIDGPVEIDEPVETEIDESAEIDGPVGIDEPDEPAEPAEKEQPKKAKKKQKRKKEAEPAEPVPEQPASYVDSAFAPEIPSIELSNEAIAASVREAEAMGAAIMGDLKAAQVSAETMFGINEQLSSYGSKKNKRARSKVSSDEEFYWYNKEDVAERPQRRPAESYYHYFNLASDCIEDLLVEMYDCALVRTEEIRYIAYGIEPRTLSMKEIMSGAVSENRKQKEPTTQDMVRIYEKWCGYVEHLFDKVEIHADEYTIEEIRKQLCEYGRSEVDVLLEGK